MRTSYLHAIIRGAKDNNPVRRLTKNIFVVPNEDGVERYYELRLGEDGKPHKHRLSVLPQEDREALDWVVAPRHRLSFVKAHWVKRIERFEEKYENSKKAYWEYVENCEQTGVEPMEFAIKEIEFHRGICFKKLEDEYEKLEERLKNK